MKFGNKICNISDLRGPMQGSHAGVGIGIGMGVGGGGEGETIKKHNKVAIFMTK